MPITTYVRRLLCQRYQDIPNNYSRDIIRTQKHPHDKICPVGRVRTWNAQSYESDCGSPSIYTQNPPTVHIFNGSSYHTQRGFTTAELMLAVGVAMALCLRASEYASRTEIPDPESHQFDSKSVEFKFSDTNVLIRSSNLLSTNWIRFTTQHAKNIQKGHGVPIWSSTQDLNEDAVAFLQLVYL